MTGQGGWPLNAFLTPDQAPFYVGHLLPARIPSRPAELACGARGGGQRLGHPARRGPPLRRLGARLDRRQRADARRRRIRSPRRSCRRRSPGCARAMTASTVALRARRSSRCPRRSSSCSGRARREMSLGTLRAMACGGINDQVGGGFARYAVDATWTVPHFEKMLYDNALLARAYLHGFQVSGDPLLRRVCEETLDWALRELRGPEGGFCAALDADSEGVEGKFYVWTRRRAARRCSASSPSRRWPTSARPSRELRGRQRARGPRPRARPALPRSARGCSSARAERVRPGLDDKRLCAWNALMITALAEAGAALRARTTWRPPAPAPSSCSPRCATARDGCCAPGRTARERSRAISRTTPFSCRPSPRSMRRPSTPAGIRRRGRWPTRSSSASPIPSTAASSPPRPTASCPSHAARTSRIRRSPRAARLRRSACCGWPASRARPATRRHALGVLRLLAPIAGRHPLAFGHALQAFAFSLAPVREVAIVGSGPDADALAAVVRGGFSPRVVLAGGSGDGIALLEGREHRRRPAAAYVCEHFACQAPVTEPER